MQFNVCKLPTGWVYFLLGAVCLNPSCHFSISNGLDLAGELSNQVGYTLLCLCRRFYVFGNSENGFNLVCLAVIFLVQVLLSVGCVYRALMCALLFHNVRL